MILPPSLEGKITTVFENDEEIHLKASSDAPIGSVFELYASANDDTHGFYEKKIEIKVVSMF